MEQRNGRIVAMVRGKRRVRDLHHFVGKNYQAQKKSVKVRPGGDLGRRFGVLMRAALKGEYDSGGVGGRWVR
jgi:hypothetical protein